MKKIRTKLLITTMAVSLAAVLSVMPIMDAIEATKGRPITLGQTEGYINGERAVFAYTHNFFCSNADFNEANCLVGVPPDPNNVLKLEADGIPDVKVIVPFFVVSPADDDSPGMLEALDPTPDVFVQCPETQSSAFNGGTPFGSFGHCVLHDVMLDTSPLEGVEVAGVTFGGEIPLPNHSHIVDKAIAAGVPWDIQVVLVLDQNLWPDEDGNCAAGSGCLTSFGAIDAAPSESIVGPVDTSLYLFFSVHPFGVMKPEPSEKMTEDKMMDKMMGKRVALSGDLTGPAGDKPFGGDDVGRYWVKVKPNDVVRVVAKLNDGPSDGMVLEGWLVDVDSGYKLSIGKLSERNTLVFTQRMVNPWIYNLVVITEEPMRDTEPSPHMPVGGAPLAEPFG